MTTVRIELCADGDDDNTPGQPWTPPEEPPSPDGSAPQGDGKHRK
ncbi:hypothetical protein [Streptomyces hyaluromycini]|nr:hypothetical protein [Streptomyces hyaluromycini]